jgi:PPOX class probable F420-dependent enzyme
MPDLQPFKNQEYVCLETFRKSGAGVKTPVWFAQEGEALYILTGADSGKAKRIRANPRVSIAPSNQAGKVSSAWLPAQASVDESEAAVQHVTALLRQKLGFKFTLFSAIGNLTGRRQGQRRTAIKVTLSADGA